MSSRLMIGSNVEIVDGALMAGLRERRTYDVYQAFGIHLTYIIETDNNGT